MPQLIGKPKPSREGKGLSQNEDVSPLFSSFVVAGLAAMKGCEKMGRPPPIVHPIQDADTEP